MATDAATIKQNYPLPVYNYRVTIGDQSLGFSEVSGLQITHDPVTYMQSQTEERVGPNMMFMPGKPTPAELTLKRGFIQTNQIEYLYEWMNTIELNQTDKRDVLIDLCDEKGKALIRWKAIDAFPVTLEAPHFEANSEEAAIEALTLMASTVQFEKL